MIESNTYHAFYMNTPRLHNWTITHGGSYYAEVGKNIKIDYITTEKVVVSGYDGNRNVTSSQKPVSLQTKNSTNQTANKPTQQDSGNSSDSDLFGSSDSNETGASSTQTETKVA